MAALRDDASRTYGLSRPQHRRSAFNNVLDGWHHRGARAKILRGCRGRSFDSAGRVAHGREKAELLKRENFHAGAVGGLARLDSESLDASTFQRSYAAAFASSFFQFRFGGLMTRPFLMALAATRT